jgi:hypothetical protein
MGLVALLVATGGMAFAAIPAADGSVSACYAVVDGVWLGTPYTTGDARIVDEAETCRPHERPLGLAGASQITALSARIAALESKLAKVRYDATGLNGAPTLTLDGANLQIVDGSGTTDGDVNGLGNLFIGYDEHSSQEQTGSHNLVIGIGHTFTSSGGLVAGYRNTIAGRNASVSGGLLNKATAEHSSVSGGLFNTASAAESSVSGGNAGKASGRQSSVSGGQGNKAEGFGASVSGGRQNQAIGQYSSVSGGQGNKAIGQLASILGGLNRIVGSTAGTSP